MIANAASSRWLRTPAPALILSGLLLPAPGADARDEDDPPIQDLFKTDLVFAQARGEVQLSVFPSYSHGPEGTTFQLPLGLEYGITDSLQLEAEWESYVDEGGAGSGQGNASVGLMYSLTDIGGSGIHAAAGFEYELASGDHNVLEDGIREDSQALYLILAKDLAPRARSQLFLQVGVELHGDLPAEPPVDDSDETILEPDVDPRNPGDPNIWYANLGGYSVWGPVVVSLELNLSEDEAERYATPGISWRPMDGAELGLGVAAGLTRESDDYQIIGKLLWEFGG